MIKIESKGRDKRFLAASLMCFSFFTVLGIWLELVGIREVVSLVWATINELPIR